MAKVRTTVYIDTETNAALRDYARRHRISIGEANNLLLRRALFGGLDEGMEAMLVPEIRKAVGEAARREIQENMSRLLGAQTDRLFGVLVTCGRDAYVARKLAKDVLDDSTGSAQWANDREQDALLASRRRYTREGLREAASEER
jgi:hypothetical protein